MTVKELIDKLIEIKNQDLPVYIPEDPNSVCDCCYGGETEVVSVYEYTHSVRLG